MRTPELGRLADIMARLRAPDGCPWDREQSLETLRHYLLEETHEVLEVMTGDDPAAHCEELGDLLLQVAFQSQIRAERGEFELADAVDAICDKLVRRHPHVFGDESADDAARVAQRWEEIKRDEGKAHGVAGVSEHLPALMRADKVGHKAAKAGFDWPADARARGPIAKVREELAELEEVVARDPIDAARAHAELGDLLFAVVNVARHLGVRPELALHDATARFADRFARVEGSLAAVGLAMATTPPDVLDAHWEAAKVAASRAADRDTR
ncbi:MAG: nucleoside triphosphate pyrophosphohydrolase [Deltaproteobacteria bacterium]|nr:nucleoside triphosphate pyrophosphohydrolase [Deltaproteobacteria bacterium]